MTDVPLPLDTSYELRRLTLASAIRDVTLAKLEMALARERAKKAVLLEAAKEALELHERMRGSSYVAGDIHISMVLRRAIAAAENEGA